MGLLGQLPRGTSAFIVAEVKTLRRYLPHFSVLLLALSLTACGRVLPSGPASGGSQVAKIPLDTQGGIATKVNMGDAPPRVAGKQLAHLNLGIREIDAIDSTGRRQVVAQYAQPLMIDVLQYQGGSGKDLGQAPMNGQTYSGLRFVIDIAASDAVYADDAVVGLTFADNAPSLSTAEAGETTTTSREEHNRVAITVMEQFSVRADFAEVIHADFNAFESLAPLSGSNQDENGDNSSRDGGGLLVRPALFVATDWDAGQISGTVVNRDGDPVSGATVVAFGSGQNVGNTVSTDGEGNFNLHSLSSGTYRLQVYNAYKNAAGASFSAHGATSEKNSLEGPTVTVNPGGHIAVGSVTD